MHNKAEIVNALGLCINGLCDGCDYRSDDTPCSCKYMLMRDVMALIRPRILTWDEAVLDEWRDVLYIEKKGDCIPGPGIIVIGSKKYAGFMSPLGDDEGHLGIKRDLFGIEYRFWSCKPSKKQMEDTPWKEQIEEVKECK